MSSPIQMHSRADVVAKARSWKETRFRHQGRNEAGIDCCGLIIKVGNDLGLFVYETNDYDRHTSGEDFVHHFHDAGCIPIPLGSARDGDIIITSDFNFPCHCGIVSTKRRVPHLIHAFMKRRKVVEEPLEHWLPIATHAFRYPGVAD